jgi:hypothetical protein
MTSSKCAANPGNLVIAICLMLATLLILPKAAEAQTSCASGNVATPALLTSANCQASATGTSSTAVGNGAAANGNVETSIGQNAGGATVPFVNLVGPAGTGSTNLGVSAGAGSTGIKNTSIGEQAGFNQLGGQNVTIGAEAGTPKSSIDTTSFDNTVAIGFNTHATQSGNVAVGVGAWSSGANDFFGNGTSVAVGHEAAAGGGFFNAFTNIGTTAIGANAQAGSTAAAQINATAMGNNALANAANATAVGQGAQANSAAATAFGQGAHANFAGATAIGQGAQANFAGATAIGQGATASGDPATSVGMMATASGNNSLAVGANATASDTSAIAVGQGSTAGFANSMAIGQGVTTARPNQVLVGTATNTYTMPGISSAASLAAQTGPVSFVTSDASGNLATSSFNAGAVTTLQGNVATLQNNVAILQGNVGVLQQQMRQSFEGTAMAIAMGGSALPGDKRFAISTNLGTFRGESAFGLLAQARVSDHVVLNGGVSTGFAQGGVGGRVGATFAW